MIFAAVRRLTAAVKGFFFLIHFPIYCCEYKKTAENDEQQIQFFPLVYIDKSCVVKFKEFTARLVGCNKRW